jgi:hypothetical protein
MTHTQAVNTLAAERYLLNEMSEVERHAFEEHYFSCRECAEDVRAGGAMRDAVRAGLLQTGPGARTGGEEKVRRPDFTAGQKRAGGRPRFDVILPWAIAATLAVAVGYQPLGPKPSAELRPQALAPITVRAATRGAEPAVPLRSDSAAVTLALEVNSGTAVELAYDLRTADGQDVAAGRVPAPAAGAPLLLLLPAAALAPDTRYVLAIRNAGNGELLGEFRFSATRA